MDKEKEKKLVQYSTLQSALFFLFCNYKPTKKKRRRKNKKYIPRIFFEIISKKKKNKLQTNF